VTDTEREAATACLRNAESELTKAAEAVSGLLQLAKISAAVGRTGAADSKLGTQRLPESAIGPAGASFGPRPTVPCHEHKRQAAPHDQARARQEGRHRRGHHGRQAASVTDARLT
jgi:hypothetical protein